MSETTTRDADRLPHGCHLVQAFDLANGGYAYHVTGENAPAACHWKHFKSAKDAVDDALRLIRSEAVNASDESWTDFDH